MSHLDRDPRGEPSRGSMPPPRPRTHERTSVRQAVWSAVTAVVMIFLLFVVFYGISAQRDTTTARRTEPPSAPTLSSSTTGQGDAPATPQTRGGSGTSDDGRQEGDGAR